MKKLLIPMALLLLAIAIMPSAKAATETVYTDLFFNIGAVDELTVTLLGESAVTSAGGAGTATPANIEFNVTNDTYWQNATVVGGSTQDTTNPILLLDNTGTTNLEINISINSTLPASTCTMILRYINDSAACDIAARTPETEGAVVSTTNITIDASFGPAEANWCLWLYGNFSGCLDADDTAKRFTIYATTV